MKVFWNVASRKCVDDQVEIPLDEFRITHNKDKPDSYQITDPGERNPRLAWTAYEPRFDLGNVHDATCHYIHHFCSGINKESMKWEDPKNISLQAHLDAVAQLIQVDIPDPNFDGIAVIDLEAWRPLYHMNWDEKKVYKEQSVQLVLQNQPYLSTEEAEALAEQQFNRAARDFFVQTLRVARELRPRGLWGYYEYPFCNYDAGDQPGDYSCTTTAQQYNEQLRYIYHASSALFPSIYLHGTKTTEQNFRYVQAVLMEARRIAHQRGHRSHFFPYTKIEYDPEAEPTWFYSKDDLCNTVKQSADLGASGVVVWSTSKNMSQRCAGIANYVRKVFGPCTSNMNTDDYMCRCHRQYQGPDCSIPNYR
ncbi:hyaluronoglucosaminidase [Teladorsagia circumcincta]|uniref:Hyaluronidase n=1 Tax=Teladorsagia circumcincta TaxID=45464 RepID=A0A2G9U6F6_TELCI|nr:hyaluronoglucosaminidase [Teladorsagia circumcincta]